MTKAISKAKPPFGVDVAAIEKDLAPKPKKVQIGNGGIVAKKTPTKASGAARASKGVRAAAGGKKGTTKKPARKAGAKK